MKKTILFTTTLFITLLSITEVNGIPGTWQSTNPGGGGWFARAGAGPSGVLLVGSDLSGAYRTHDQGESWDNIGASQGMTATHVACFAFDPLNHDIYYVGTDKGIYRTADNGVSFKSVLGSGYIESMVFSAVDADIGYAGWHPVWNSNEGQIYKTIDRGLSWSLVSESIPTGHRILELQLGVNTSDTIYVLTGEGRFAEGPADLFLSTTGGDSWTLVSSGISDTVVDIAADKFNPAVIWASADGSNSGYLYRSNDCGNNWAPVTNRGGYIWLDTEESQTIRMAELRRNYPWENSSGIWESTSAGSTGTWTKVSSVDDWVWGWSLAHWVYNANLFAPTQDPSNPDRLYWCNSQFVYGTLDRGRNVTQLYCNETGTQGAGRWLSRGVDNVNMMAIVISEADHDLIYAGFFDIGIWRSQDHGASWSFCNTVEHTGGWNGYGGNTAAIAADPARAGVVWTTLSPFQNGEEPTYLLRSSKKGNPDSWEIADTGLPRQEVMGISVDPNSPEDSRVLFVTAKGNVYRSTDDGYNWSLVFTNGGCRFTAIDRFSGNLVYAGGESGLWRSINGGDGWTQVGSPHISGSGSFWEWGFAGVFGIVTDPHNAGRVYVSVFGSGKGLYRSSDTGDNWEKILDDDYMRRCAVSPINPDIIIATSSRALEAGGDPSGSHGVLYSGDGGQNWEQINEGLTWPFAVPVAFEPADSSMVWIGSPGLGIHKRNLSTTTDSKNCTAPPVAPSVSLFVNSPFGGKVSGYFTIDKRTLVRLGIFNAAGRKQARIIENTFLPGTHDYCREGSDGRRIAPGVYFIVLETDLVTLVRKVILLRY